MIRWGAFAAIAGGLLRIADSFTMGVLSPAVLAVLYAVTDGLLLAGVAALWWTRRATIGWTGRIGLGVFVLGILAIRAAAFGLGSYPLGATAALLGVAVYALEALTRGARLAPLAWLLALAAGIAGAAGVAPAGMTALAGVLFGLGFVAAGVATL